MKLQDIPLSSIKFEDDTFSLTPMLTGRASKKLSQSIRRVGVLHPPIIMEIATGIYRIGSGRQRLLAAKDINCTSCTCYVFKAQTHPLDIFSYIYEEASHTTLPLISKAIFLKKTGQWLTTTELAKKFMAGFGLKENDFHVKKLQQLTQLEINIQEELHQNHIDEKVCHELVKLDFIDRMGLFDIIMKLSLSVANQRKLLLSCREIAIRKQMTIAQFLGEKQLSAVLGNQTLNPPQKSSNFMAKLAELRSPLLSEAQYDFNNFTKSLPLTKVMTIQHSPSFEKDELFLTITCKSRKELSKTINSLISPTC